MYAIRSYYVLDTHRREVLHYLAREYFRSANAPLRCPMIAPAFLKEGLPVYQFVHHDKKLTSRSRLCQYRITSYNVCYTKLLRNAPVFITVDYQDLLVIS